MFTMTKEYINSFAAPTYDDVLDYIDAPAKAVKHENGKWYATCPNQDGKHILDENGNYFALAEITPDAKYIGPVGKNTLNEDTAVEERDLPEIRNFRMKDGRWVFVSINKNGEYKFDKEHILNIMHPDCK